MQIYYEEIKKAFKSRRTWLILLIILAIQIGSIVPDYLNFKGKCGSVSKYNEYANQYNNQISEEFVKQEDIESMKNESYYGSDTSIDTIFYNQYLAAVCRSINWKDKNGEKNAPRFWNSIGINKLVQNLNSSISAVFVFIGLLFGISSIFTWDEENGMDQIIYSSSRGRRLIISAKCLGSMVFMFFWVTVYYLSIMLATIGLYQNGNVLKVRINNIASLGYCIADLKVWQFLLVGYLFMLLSGILMSLLFAFIYSRVRNSVLSLGIGIVLIFMPIIVPKNGAIGRFFCMLPTIFCDICLIIGENVRLTLGKKEIPLMYLGSVVMFVMSVLMYIIIKKTFWKGRVE